MKVKHLIGVIGLGLVTSVGTTAQAQTIQEAIRTAINSHPEVSAAKHEVLAREQEIKGAKAGYLPLLMSLPDSAKKTLSLLRPANKTSA